jgi:hypothetical protein
MTKTIRTYPTVNTISCVWIETGNPKRPLACVWIDEKVSFLKASREATTNTDAEGIHLCA